MSLSMNSQTIIDELKNAHTRLGSVNDWDRTSGWMILGDLIQILEMDHGREFLETMYRNGTWIPRGDDRL